MSKRSAAAAGLDGDAQGATKMRRLAPGAPLTPPAPAPASTTSLKRTRDDTDRGCGERAAKRARRDEMAVGSPLITGIASSALQFVAAMYRAVNRQLLELEMLRRMRRGGDSDDEAGAAGAMLVAEPIGVC